ncbi:MAG TPA: hypothetical protein VEY09_18785 [Pyrinomonadaceae bacterium]|nr:hypothetical protein [Pyrinomonadaceae bacterium]
MDVDFHPYVGPRPFEHKDRNLFFGRNRETSEIMSRVIAHPIVLLYSQSGAGKTSLLNAKLIPMLQKEGFETIGPTRVRGELLRSVAPENITNIYVFNALSNLAGERADLQLLAETTITSYLKDHRKNPDSPCVLIFDQFEELFNYHQGRWNDRRNLFEQLSDALSADSLMRVIFVMREEYIAELDPYAQMLPERLRTRFRLERLSESAALEAIKMPLRGTNYSFASGVAQQLVTNLRKFQIETTAGAKEAIGEFVEPVQLQVVCQTLWQRCQAAWRDQPSGERVITSNHLEAFGDVNEALTVFYERAIHKIVQSAVVNEERQATSIKEGELRRWFEHALITPSGTRGTVYGGGEDVGGIPVEVVKQLENEHLIVGVERGGARWYELTHDRLIEPIKGSNEKWFLQRLAGAEQLAKLLELRAAKWVRSGRDPIELLREGELAEAIRWLNSPQAADVGYSEFVIALVHASRAAAEEAAREREQALAVERQRRAEAEQRATFERERAEDRQRMVEEQTKAAKRLRWVAAALGIMFLLAVGATILALNKRSEAEANAQKASAARTEAEANAQRAIAAQTTAEELRRKAEADARALKEAKELAQKEAENAEKARRKAEEQTEVARTNVATALRSEAALKKSEAKRREMESIMDSIAKRSSVLRRDEILHQPFVIPKKTLYQDTKKTPRN